MVQPTEARILTQIKDVNSLSDMLAQQYSDLKRQVSESRRVQEPSQPHANGSHSESGRDNGTPLSPRGVQVSSQDLPSVSPVSTVPRTMTTPTKPGTPSIMAPREPRSVSDPSSATTSQPSYTSLQIKGKASQRETGKGHTPTHPHDHSLGSRVAPAGPRGMKASLPPSSFKDSPNTALQNASGSSQQNSKKRQRLSPSLDGHDDTSPDTVFPMVGDASHVSSSSSYPPRKKKKAKKDKKDKRPSQLK